MPRPRPGLLDIAPYVGGESKLEGVSRPIKLSSNEGALGPSPKAMAAFQAAATRLHRYPDGAATALRRALGDLHRIDPARIVCGAGSDELIDLLCRAYAGPGDEVLQTEHGFSIYGICARAVGATPVMVAETALTADVDKILAGVTGRTKLVFIANPNNPTGTYLPEAEVRRLRAGLPDHVLLVLDAAYAEFVERDDYEAGAALVEAGDNVVMTRTFSKIYGMGGMRLGWAYGPAGVVDVLNRIRLPFNVNMAAQAAGVAAVGDRAFISHARAHNSRWLAWTGERLHALGFHVHPSVGNFLLVDIRRSAGLGHNARSAEAADAFLRRRGLIVRRVAGYGLPDCLRISIGTGPEMEALAAAMEVYATMGPDGG